MFKITIIDNKGKKREFNNLPSLIAYANSFQMSWLPDGFSWYIQEPSTDFVDDLEKMKDFFKLTKEEFLNSYSYVNEAEYDATAEKVTKENIKFEDIEEFVRRQNKLNYYLIIDASDKLDDDILSIPQNINALNNIPYKISIMVLIIYSINATIIDVF